MADGYRNEAGQFAPWSNSGDARTSADGRIVTATMFLKPEAGMRLLSAEIHSDAQFLTCVFEIVEEEVG